MSSKSLLQRGDTIGLITPAGVIKQRDWDQLIKNLEILGLKARYSKSIFSVYKEYLAGSDEKRIEELHKIYTDKEVKAVLAVRGGYGCSRIAEGIDYDLIRKYPKPLIGYSDLTFLQFALYKKLQIPSLHGITGNRRFSYYTRKLIQEYLFEDHPQMVLTSKESEIHKYTPKQESYKGILIGGNLTILLSLLGTPFDIPWDDAVIFIEEINEPVYKVDRMLQQLFQAGKFQKVQAVLFGKFSESNGHDFQTNALYEQRIHEIIKEKFLPRQIPYIFGLSFGHIQKQMILPFGTPVTVDFTDASIHFLRKDWQSFFEV